jgi:hypothetical protein
MKKQTLTQTLIAWTRQYERVERIKSSLRKAKRQLKILRAIMADKESKGEKYEL